ncbi:MAG: hypothetical protein JSV77_04860 [Dehalococcoidales bacterium]|nr:MAG: hypothetical protein JSV77_04860 [Dehalococcoidales bacterium]
MEILQRILPTIIPVIAWIVALVFAVKMIRNDGGRPELFLLIGVSLLLVSSVVGSVWAGLTPLLMDWLIDTEADIITVGWSFSAIRIVCAIISLAGIIFLVYAFWQKFKYKTALT